MQISWTMNIKQNGRFHTTTTHDKFRTNKIQNGRQSAILNFFIIISEILHDSWSKNFCSLILHKSITCHRIIFGNILIPI